MADLEKRQLKQIIAFYGTGLAALGASLVVRRSVVARRYSPLMFDPNQRPPSFNMMKDAVQAVSNATMLSVSCFAFGIASVSWIADVGSIREFGLMMKEKLGGAERERELAKMPLEENVAEFEQSLNESLAGKKA
ncbi:hypothetical protein TRVA0_017S02102 [Trichomonascus vanleenenianus]|uniref:Aim11p n=1 Tax=Trichomonascus vanleenenianus TaxID=2268995 RepID=UPI003ECAB429